MTPTWCERCGGWTVPREGDGYCVVVHSDPDWRPE